MTTPPHTRRALEAQMAICQDLLTHFKKDRDDLRNLLAGYAGGTWQSIYAAAIQTHRTRLTNTGQNQPRKLVTELRTLANMVEDDERFAVAEIDKVLQPDAIAQPASNPETSQQSSRTSWGPVMDHDADGTYRSHGESSGRDWRGH